jgi:glucosamine-6-phosphate deaminase
MHVTISRDRALMGRRAAKEAAWHLKEAVRRQGSARVAFAAAPSQNEFLAALRQDGTVPWESLTAFHLDEYIGLPKDAPQRFRAYLDEHLFNHVTFREVHYLEAAGANPEEACRRYESLLGGEALELVCLGIGENGHLAFNDPHVADFADPARVKIVDLDEVCRQQQVNDGCFASLDEVPRQAITLTLPTIASAKAIVCVVPGARKNRAVKQALYGPISPACPASILRTHPSASLFLDEAAGEGIVAEAADV